MAHGLGWVAIGLHEATTLVLLAGGATLIPPRTKHFHKLKERMKQRLKTREIIETKAMEVQVVIQLSCISPLCASIMQNPGNELYRKSFESMFVNYLIQNHVVMLEDSTIDADQVDNLIKFCPTKQEMELLKFFLELLKLPRIESKLRVLSFKLQFNIQVSNLRKSLNIINSAVEQVVPLGSGWIAC
ncbi:hypothetical protein L1887_12789 [Cichorium endivia]|nr:hypothetical protein L1887_12789 [Cichorium endivia]